MSVLSLLTGLSHLIFFGVPPLLQPAHGGRLSQGGKEKFVKRLAFRRARGQRRNEEAVTSLKAYRVEFIEPLTEYPGAENGRGGTSKCDRSATSVYSSVYSVYSSSTRLFIVFTRTKLYRCKVDNWLETCDREELRKIC